MKKKSGNELLVLFEDDKWLQRLYDELLPKLEKHVLNNSGTIQDAKDLFQEALVVTYKKVANPDFVLTSAIETFVFSIGKRKWLYELRKRKNNINLMEISDEPGNIMEEMIINHEKHNLYLRHLNQLSDGCQEVLRLFFNGFRMSEIAKKLGFASEGYARKRKHECQSRLVKLIREDSIYKELRNG